MQARQNLPTLRQLRYFVALCEAGHFGRAAESCAVSQSAFSHAIRELELVLDCQLVDRTKRSVTITNIGQELAAQARLCLQDAKSLVHMAAAGSGTLTGRLVMGVIPTIAPFVLPAALPRIRAAYPDLQLFLREAQTRTAVAALMDGSIDLVCLALPWAMRNVEVMELFHDPFHLAYHRDTTLIEPDRFRLNRLTAGSVMLLEDGHCLRQHALAACRIANLDSISQFSASSMITLPQMINADLGVSFVPEMLINAGGLNNTNIATRPMSDSSYRTIALAWRKGSNLGAEFTELGKLLCP